MQTIIWGFGSMLVLLLVLLILPIGFTLKGKLFTAIASFILALGGVAAASTFSLWQTAIMLLALVFFSAYFLDQRLAALFYKAKDDMEDEYEEENESIETESSFNHVRENHSSLDIPAEPVLPETSVISLEKAELEEVIEAPVTAEIKELGSSNSEIIPEDVSFLLEREATAEIVDVQEEIVEPETGYLSDIESLLQAEEVEMQEESELDEFLDISTDSIEVISSEQTDETQKDDSLFEFLLAAEEAAAGDEDTLEIIEPKKQVTLQK